VSPLPPELEAVLRPLRRRALADLAVRSGLFGLAGWGGATALLFAWAKASPTPDAGLVAGLLGAAAAALSAAAWALRRPGDAQVARVADARLRLSERLASALCFADSLGEMETRLRRDAVERAGARRAGEAYPLSRHRRLAAVGLVAVVATASLAFTPNPQSGVLARRAADSLVLSEARHAVGEARQRFHYPSSKYARQAARLLDQALAKLRHDTTPLAALVDLSGLEAEIQSLQSAANSEQGALEAAVAAAAGALGRAPQAAALGRDLAAGNLRAALAELSTLTRQRPKLGSKAEKALSAALASASAASAGLGGAGAASLQQGLAAAAAAVANAEQKVAGQAQADMGGPKGGPGRSGSHQAPPGPKSAGGSGTRNGSASKPGSGSGGQGRAKGAGTGPGQGAGNGNLAGTGQGSGGTGSGSGSGQGSGAAAGASGGGAGGAGAGAGASVEKHPGQSSGWRGRGGGANFLKGGRADQVFIAGQAGAAEEVAGSHLGAGYAVKTTPYQAVLPSFAKTALEGLGTQVVSPEDQRLVRDYFSSLGSP
jgi:hypothetical protein